MLYDNDNTEKSKTGRPPIEGSIKPKSLPIIADRLEKVNQILSELRLKLSSLDQQLESSPPTPKGSDDLNLSESDGILELISKKIDDLELLGRSIERSTDSIRTKLGLTEC
jgi:hypothetical protein